MAKKPVKLDDKGYRKFGMRDKLAYAAGDFGCNMSFALKSTVQTFWLVYMMMETGLLSLLLLLVQIWDAVNDPLLGTMIDNDKRKYKHGKFKQYIFIGACGLRIVWIYTIFKNATHLPVDDRIGVLFTVFPVSWIVTICALGVCFLVIWKKRLKLSGNEV